MEQLGSARLWSFLDRTKGVEEVSNTAVRQDRGRHVSSYLDLAAKIAELQFRNPGYVLLFRGQSIDHRSGKARLSTLKPSIFRAPKGKLALSRKLLEHRFKCLDLAEKRLAGVFEKLNRLGVTKVQRQRLLRWSILQHYEVCPTPLLDVSQSLRIGASFASLDAAREVFLFALAVPNVSGTVTANVEEGVQIVRLAGACPPTAIRPHIQEGYLLGECPDFESAAQADYYQPYHLDLGRRLIAKFRFEPAQFWHDDKFPQVTRGALYPPSKDWLEIATAEIRSELEAIPSP